VTRGGFFIGCSTGALFADVYSNHMTDPPRPPPRDSDVRFAERAPAMIGCSLWSSYNSFANVAD
jgi:hypothetical protein